MAKAFKNDGGHKELPYRSKWEGVKTIGPSAGNKQSAQWMEIKEALMRKNYSITIKQKTE